MLLHRIGAAATARAYLVQGGSPMVGDRQEMDEFMRGIRGIVKITPSCPATTPAPAAEPTPTVGSRLVEGQPNAAAFRKEDFVSPTGR